MPRANQFQGRTQLREACLIRLDRIVADPNQPRGEFDADSLERLAGSLKQRGQLQPIRVRWDEADQHYVVVIGERRWRAAKLAGLESIACIVVPGTATPEEILEDQLVENCLREDLKPIEQARAYQSLMQRLGLSQRALAEKLDVSQGQIMQSLKLLELPEPIRESIDDGKIAPSIGYEIAKVDRPRAADRAGRAGRPGRGRPRRGAGTDGTGAAAEALELHARRRQPGGGDDPGRGSDGRGSNRSAPEGDQAGAGEVAGRGRTRPDRRDGGAGGVKTPGWRKCDSKGVRKRETRLGAVR